MFLMQSYLTGQHGVLPVACHEKLLLVLTITGGSVFLHFLTPHYVFLVFCGETETCCFQIHC